VVRVRDEGAGIPPERLPHVMDPFFTTKRPSGGTGLGLSVSASIIKDHGGSLSFASAVGSGTTVTLRLPVADDGDVCKDAVR
jgi:polar amino acid transport system substrate-binding protein